jgi:hypothetical protein
MKTVNEDGEMEKHKNKTKNTERSEKNVEKPF